MGSKLCYLMFEESFIFVFSWGVVCFGDENGYLLECMLCYINYRYYRIGGLLDIIRNYDNWEK